MVFPVYVVFPSHHHCQGFLSLPNLFHVLPNGRESSSSGPGLRRNDQFPRSPPPPTPTAPAPASHHLQGVVEGLPQTPHTKVTGRAPTITPHPQFSPPLNGPRRKRHQRRPELKLNHSAVGKLKGSSSGTRTMLHEEGRKQT